MHYAYLFLKINQYTKINVPFLLGTKKEKSNYLAYLYPGITAFCIQFELNRKYFFLYLLQTVDIHYLKTRMQLLKPNEKYIKIMCLIILNNKYLQQLQAT